MRGKRLSHCMGVSDRGRMVWWSLVELCFPPRPLDRPPKPLSQLSPLPITYFPKSIKHPVLLLLSTVHTYASLRVLPHEIFAT